jgi:tRNA A37 threonylcarbamoyladenosine modification protein TsaB
VQIAGVPSVEAVVAQAQADGLRGQVNVVTDAQRGEFYLGSWDVSATERRELKPLAIVTRDTIQSLADSGETILGPDVAHWLPASRIVFPRASLLARLAQSRPAAMDGSSLEPIYLRETAFVKAPPPREV